jgi:twitching motility protein PilJ
MIQEITTQTTQGTKLTAESVGQLNSLAEELRDSVAGFKL